jgi:hypothetical protein
MHSNGFSLSRLQQRKIKLLLNFLIILLEKKSSLVLLDLQQKGLLKWGWETSFNATSYTVFKELVLLNQSTHI